MVIVPVSEALSELGLNEPNLKVCSPTRDDYRVQLLQPKGELEVDRHGVRHSDRELATAQFGKFLDDSAHLQFDLAVCPEYSMPWQVLESKITTGVLPPVGGIWVLGCESITHDELLELKSRVGSKAEIIFEPLDAVDDRFLNPVVYVFRTSKADNATDMHTVVLVQFKICPMGDAEHYEVDHLQLGTQIYCFGAVGTIRLATLICSDAFEFLDEHAEGLFDRTLLLHIQLNPKPCQSQFSAYRGRFLRYAGNETEILCLNWARNVRLNKDGIWKDWNNIAGSCWYVARKTLDHGKDTLVKNHHHGLYYTWIQSLRCHALFFNYDAAVYRLFATKVAHIGVAASLSKPRGPRLLAALTWNSNSKSWVRNSNLDDGFNSVSKECGAAETDMKELVATDPFDVERVLALTSGSILGCENWYSLKNLDSCTVEQTVEQDEVIRRITVRQDKLADSFRLGRLRQCSHLYSILTNFLPPSIEDLSDGFTFHWNARIPHHNVISADGVPATLIYLGESDPEHAEPVRTMASEFIGRSYFNGYDTDKARQRLLVWYRATSGDDVLLESHGSTNYDDPRTDSPIGITRLR